MAKVLQTLSNSNITNPSRGQITQGIGSNIKDFVNKTPIADMVNLTPLLAIFFSKDVYNTTYGNNTKEAKHIRETDRYIEIQHVPLYMNSGKDIDSEGQQDRAINIHLTSKTFYLLPMNEIVPKEGDHLILEIQEKYAYPYQITKVTPVLLAEKPGFEVEMSQSPVWSSINEIRNNVTKTLVYTGYQDGAGSRVIREKNIDDMINKLNNTFSYLSKSYTDAFYDNEYDVLYISNKDKYDDNIHYTRTLYYLVSMAKMQEYNPVLTYGFNANKLFLTLPVKAELEEPNYKYSIFYKMITKTFCKRKPNMMIHSTDDDSYQHMLDILTERDYYNEVDGFKYKSKYSYGTKFYIKSHYNHSILSRFYNVEDVISEIYETVKPNSQMTWNYISYELENPTISYFLDLYMDNDINTFVDELGRLERYIVYKENIDDFIGIPLLLIALKAIISDLNGKQEGTYY